jgi:glycosyltransferase involved in cell wall biosynthesis
MLIPASGIASWARATVEGVDVLYLRAPKTKDVSYLRRTIGEFLMPFAMRRHLRMSPIGSEQWDCVVWYSPTIFFGPLVTALKRRSHCPSYLIVRDLFPDWAVDMGILRRGLVYRCLKMIEQQQYRAADVIGIQSEGNRRHFERSGRGFDIEVLQNWLADAPHRDCSIDVSRTKLAGRKIFVYAGNMGVAQGMPALIELTARFRERSDVGFLFVGRGKYASALDARARTQDNLLFEHEIPSDEIPGLYAQCHIGLVSLDTRHKTHNVPGKFLTYMQSGLPVLASINPGNDLAALISAARVGRVVTDGAVDSLYGEGLALLASNDTDPGIGARCRSLFEARFSPDRTVRQIVDAMTAKRLQHQDAFAVT